MKSLLQFIKEASEEKVASSKKLTFNFTDFEGAEETIKSLQEIADKDGVNVEVEDSKVTVTLSKDNVESAEGVFELLQDYIQLRGKDQKRASDEQYAQKCHKLESTLNDWREFVDDSQEDDEASEEDKKDDKNEDKKEEE